MGRGDKIPRFSILDLWDTLTNVTIPYAANSLFVHNLFIATNCSIFSNQTRLRRRRVRSTASCAALSEVCTACRAA